MKRILIVDDQSGWRDFHSNALKNADSQIIIETADFAGEAYSKILENNTNPYDIILTDLQMEEDYTPKLAGEWLVEQIKELPAYYKTKIIIISASPRIKFIAENYNVEFIPKAKAVGNVEKYKEILL